MGAARKLETTRNKPRIKKPRKVPADVERKLMKVGNGYAALIPRSIMALLGIDGSTRVTYETDGTSLIIRPVRSVGRGDKMTAAVDHVFTRYRKTMSTLAGK